MKKGPLFRVTPLILGVGKPSQNSPCRACRTTPRLTVPCHSGQRLNFLTTFGHWPEGAGRWSWEWLQMPARAIQSWFLALSSIRVKGRSLGEGFWGCPALPQAPHSL
jgi:hypothetical protein